jgi:micrococcal nuclease
MYEYAAVLRSVHDGDTVRLDVDLGFDIHHAALDVRLLGIDCPELGRPDRRGEQARDFTNAWFYGHAGPYRLTTVRDRVDKYGRYLATIAAPDGAVLASDLLGAGLAKPYSGNGPRPVFP